MRTDLGIKKLDPRSRRVRSGQTDLCGWVLSPVFTGSSAVSPTAGRRAGQAVFVFSAAWNSTPWLVDCNRECPVGFYTVLTTGKLAINDLVLIKPAEAIATFPAQRGYLPPAS